MTHNSPSTLKPFPSEADLSTAVRNARALRSQYMTGLINNAVAWLRRQISGVVQPADASLPKAL